MTGVAATEPYDIERVQAINRARERKDCPGPGDWDYEVLPYEFPAQ